MTDTAVPARDRATATTSSAASPAAPHRRSRRDEGPFQARRRRLFWPFVAVPLVLYLVFFLGPTLASFWISLHAWDGIGEMKFRGLGNYEVLLGDEVFRGAFANTLIILVGVGLAVFVASFALAMVLRELAGRKFARAVLFFPNIIAPIVLSVLWGFIFQNDGLLDSALQGIGISDGPNWLGDHLFFVILLGLAWVNTGFYVTIIMAGVDRIPPYLYEDCKLAGANAFQRFWHVTLPLTWDVVATSAILWTISSLKIFEFLYAFGGTTNDMPPTGVWNSALFIYGQTFGGRTPPYLFGYASAAAVVTLLFLIVLVFLFRRVLRREVIEF
ncbi:carbohydrate ABC transporter permease [Streptomyces luteolus]|uniref:Sugar ABC transporter permease n=1 Tax=Streptomyces luteolus TaxID=3043615 RepID=A0ABT6ST06_9ACTN|nr:sugar ABC transporter permease [Streptomyces sp. B-S-A12]MDI3418740.1 sugar ABC transporter permease [Streptomyces sp. B-S-A12]